MSTPNDSNHQRATASGFLTATGAARQLHASLHAAPQPHGQHTFSLTVRLDEPWHLYAPESPVGVRVDVTVSPPMQLRNLAIPKGTDGELGGTFTITGTLVNAQPGDLVTLHSQACDGARCERPIETALVLTNDVT